VNRDVFPAVEPASPVCGEIERLREVVQADPSLAVDGDARVRTELVTRRSADGAVRVRRFLWSVQRPAPGTPAGFAARTLFHDVARARDRAGVRDTARVPDPAQAALGGTTQVRDFPDDPELPWLARPDGSWSPHEAAAAAPVLRYIPRRRVTVRLDGVPGLPDRVIAKSQAEADLRQADRVLAEVARGVERAGTTSFRVPRTLGLDVGRRLLYLDELPGRPLSRSLDTLGADDAMAGLGAVHAELHGLDVRGLAVLTTGDSLRSAGRSAAQVAVLLPSLTRRVADLCERLRRAAPSDGVPAFCQGDFVPSQILCDPSGWSVLDLDDAHLADPYAEVAALVVALPRELSVKDHDRSARLRERYLTAYVDRAGGTFDDSRWEWHLAVARLRLAARRLVKGRAVPGETEAVLDDIDVAAPVL
jgi:aminoglycoside phosphotransferase